MNNNVGPYHQIIAAVALACLALVGPAQADHLADKTPRAKKAGKQGAPVTIVVLGDKLVVKCEDREILDLIGDLVRSLMQAQPTQRDLEVFRLKYSDAAETADLIKTLFRANPTPKQQNGDRIQTFVDPLTNTLVVQASLLDMMVLRQLLSEGIGPEITEPQTAIRTYIIGPLKHANAGDVVKVLKDVYHGSSGARGSHAGSSVAFEFIPKSAQPRMSKSKSALLSLADEQMANSVLVTCPASLFPGFKNLVDQLEAAASMSQPMGRIAPIKDFDPLVQQQALEKMQSLLRQHHAAGMFPRHLFPRGKLEDMFSRPLAGAGFPPREH